MKQSKPVFQEFVLPASWATALINDDDSGLDDTDLIAIEQWHARVQPGYCVGTVEDSYNEFSHSHDAYPELRYAGPVETFIFQEIPLTMADVDPSAGMGDEGVR